MSHRLGILGGTFDPPHLGHLRLAEAAQTHLRLEGILWVLTADPPHKQGNVISPIADRLALVEAALSDQPEYKLSRVDIDRPGPHWAADTVRLLAEQFPQAHLIYLMGGDSLRDLPTWGRPQEFLSYCSLGVMRRPADAIDLAALETRLPGLTAKVEFVPAPLIEIASHDIRRRVMEGDALDELVPPAVAQVIYARRLYGYAQSPPTVS